MTAAEEGLHAPHFPCSRYGTLNSYDHASIRRGYQVYREVCSICHSSDRIAWRNLVGSSHTVDEAKAMAEEVEYEDGSNDQGEIFQRPGKLADEMSKPYKNEEAARAGNAGALHPDLSLITKIRLGAAVSISLLHSCYSLSLLIANAPSRAGLRLCPPHRIHRIPSRQRNQRTSSIQCLLPRNCISMQRVLYGGLVEYDDGTPATTSQMAKDVVTFLSGASEPEMDERKR